MGWEKIMDYSYEELVRDIKMGREIEFSYKGKIYGTLNANEGFGLGVNDKEFIFYKNPQELLDNGTINGKKRKIFGMKSKL